MPQDHVLLIEDDKDLLEDLPKVLETYDINVSATSDYKEALNLVKQGSVSAVILDVKMPASDDISDDEIDDGRLTGLVVCKRIRAVDPTIPIIIITSSSDPKLRTFAKEAGANEIQEKPVYPDEIVQRLKRMLRRG